MHADVLIAAALAVLLPVLLLVGVRSRRPQGDGSTAAGADTSVLHCAAPPPASTARRR